MQRRDVVALRKILSEISICEGMMAEQSLESFLANEMLKRAVAMTVINVGELIKNVTGETRERYPAIPWKAAAGMRDLAAHKYQTLRMEDVYQTAVKDFPELKSLIQKILDTDA